MNELPPEARAMLALAKDAHNPPDPAARERVRTKVWAAVAIAPVGLSAGTAQLGKPSAVLVKAWFGSKSALAGGLLLLAAGGGYSALRTPEPSGPLRAPALAAPVSSAAPAAGDLPADPSAPATSAPPRPPTRAGRETYRQAAPSSLRAEVGLLERATQQLEHGDSQAALRSLAEHRRRFTHTQLQPEREGLETLVRCLQKRANAQQAARAYLARTPASVLIARIEQACAL